MICPYCGEHRPPMEVLKRKCRVCEEKQLSAMERLYRRFQTCEQCGESGNDVHLRRTLPLWQRLCEACFRAYQEGEPHRQS